MIIDTSALVAIARQEPTAENLEEILLRGNPLLDTCNRRFGVGDRVARCSTGNH